MYTNIDQKRLLELCHREPEAQLALDTMIDNHKRIIGTIGHEVRNPLTYLYSSVQLLEDKHDILAQDKHWIAFKEEVVFMKELLEQLSTYNNGSTLRMDEVDICQLLRSTIVSFASSCVDEDIEIVSDIPPLPITTIDKHKIKQVIINLLKNAKEACSPNGEIRLLARHESDNIIISIKDNGCGISDNIIEDIFTPFKTFKQGGTGLGLAITHEIITAHEGSISVHSTEGVGTEFIISIPVE